MLMFADIVYKLNNNASRSPCADVSLDFEILVRRYDLMEGIMKEWNDLSVHINDCNKWLGK